MMKILKKRFFVPIVVVFHRVQHVKSFNVTSISESMKKFGFESVKVEAIDLAIFKDRSIIKIYIALNLNLSI